MARAYNVEKWQPGKTKFNCPAKIEGEAGVVRVFKGQEQSSRTGKTVFKFMTWSEEKGRGVGRPLELDEIPANWKLA